MNFREELAKELGLGVIVQNIMLDDYVKACEAIAIRYHKFEVEKLNIPSVSLPTDEEIRSLARKYSGKNDTCSFNFHGGCNVNPRFRNDIIELVKQCNKH